MAAEPRPAVNVPACPYCEIEGVETATTLRTFHLPTAPVEEGNCYILRLFYCPKVTSDFVPAKHFSHGIVRQTFFILPCPEHWHDWQRTVTPEREGQET